MRAGRFLTSLLAAALVLAVASPAAAYPRPGRTERASVSSSGVEGNGWSGVPGGATPSRTDGAGRATGGSCTSSSGES